MCHTSWAKKAACFFQDVPFGLEGPHPTTELDQLLSLSRRERVAISHFELAQPEHQ